jgi:HSP20 family protein
MRRSDRWLPARREPEWVLSPWEEAGFSSPFMGTSPWQMMRRMQEDMDRVFSQFFAPMMAGPMSGQGQQGGQSPVGLAQWAPSTDVSENDQEWCIQADLPGVNKDDIDVHVQNRHLVLRANMRQETPEEQGSERQYHRRERRWGYFERVFPLPQGVDEEQIRCDFRNGVLSVHVPKTDQTRGKGRRIPVQDVDELPSETAGGRMRSGAELEMTAGDGGTSAARAKAGAPRSRSTTTAANGANGTRKKPATAGTKGGAASSPKSSSTKSTETG